MRHMPYFAQRCPSTTFQTCSISYPKSNARASSRGNTQNGHSSGNGFMKRVRIRIYAFCRNRTRTSSGDSSNLNASTRRDAFSCVSLSRSFAWRVLFIISHFFCFASHLILVLTYKTACSLSVDARRGLLSPTPLPPNLLSLGPWEAQQSEIISRIVGAGRASASR